MRPGSKGEHELQQELGSVERAGRFYDVQMQEELNERMIGLLKRQEMMFISTADAKGECDCSFRAGPPGFATPLNSKTIVFPELRGNGGRRPVPTIDALPRSRPPVRALLDALAAAVLPGWEVPA